MSLDVEKCHYITREKSKTNSIQNLFETVKWIEWRVQNGVYEFPWLFKVRSSLIYIEDSDPEERLRATFCSMITEQDKMIPTNHLIENYHSCVVNDKMIGDPYHPDLSEFKYFKEKPLNFLVVGKPGLNTETVAFRIAELWGSILISPSTAVQSVLSYMLEKDSKTKWQEGKQLPTDRVMEAVEFMRSSAESKRQGYVLAGFPFSPQSPYSDYKIEKQIEFIFKDINRPNIIIYMTCPNADVLLLNEGGFSRNLHNNNLYFNRHLDDGEVLHSQDSDLRLSELENNNPNSFLLKEYNNFVEEEKTMFFVRGINTTLNEHVLNNYVEKIFPILDRYLLQYDSQCVFKVDGRHTTVEIVDAIQEKLSLLCLIPLCKPKPVFDLHLIDDDGLAAKTDVQSSNSLLNYKEIEVDDEIKHEAAEKYNKNEQESSKDDDDDDDDDINNSNNLLEEETRESKVLDADFYKNLKKKEAFDLLQKHCALHKGFDLRVSDYNFLCPVEMHRGNLCEGEIDFACKFAGKLFLLSSPQAVKKFLKDPARFALSPPLSTRKLSVIGPPMTGKSTVAYYLSGFFGIKVISIRKLIEKVYRLDMKQIEGPNFEMLIESLRNLQSKENEIWMESEDQRATEISNWIKDQIPIISERLNFSSFFFNQTIFFENFEDQGTSIQMSKEPLILPHAFQNFIKTINEDSIKNRDSFEVNFGEKFVRLNVNKQPGLGFFKDYNSSIATDSLLLKLKNEFLSKGWDFFDDVVKCREFLSNPVKLVDYLPANLRLPFNEIHEVDYEDVISNSVEDNSGMHTPFGFLKINFQNLADALEEEILEIEAENNIESGFTGDLKIGGWIVDHLPVDRGLWIELMSRFLLPDDFICKTVDVNSINSVKNQFLKVEPFVVLKNCYSDLVEKSKNIQKLTCNEMFVDNANCNNIDERIRKFSPAAGECGEIDRFLVPKGYFFEKSMSCKNPFNDQDHEIKYMRANFWRDRSFLTEYFEESVAKQFQLSPNFKKVLILGNRQKIQTKDSIGSTKLDSATKLISSKSKDDYSLVADHNNDDNRVNHFSIEKQSSLSLIKDNVIEGKEIKDRSKSLLNPRISKKNNSSRTTLTNSEGIQIGNNSKVSLKSTVNTSSDEYLHWYDEKEASLTKDKILNDEGLIEGKEIKDRSKSLLNPRISKKNNSSRTTLTNSEGIQIGNISKVSLKSTVNTSSDEYLHWYDEKEVSLTNKILNDEGLCSRSNSDLSSSIASEQGGHLQNESEVSSESVESVKSTSSLNYYRELIRQSGDRNNNEHNNEMSMIALHSMMISDLNIISKSLETFLTEPFDVSSVFLKKYKTLHPDKLNQQPSILEFECRTKGELEFYRKIVSEKFNLINAIEALMNQDDNYDKVSDYLKNYYNDKSHIDDSPSERCFSTTLCSMIPKREMKVTRLPHVTDYKEHYSSSIGRKSSDSVSYDELNLYSDSLSVFDWYISDDVLFFSKHSSDFMMINNKTSEIQLKRTKKKMILPNYFNGFNLVENDKALIEDETSLESLDRRNKKSCLYWECIENMCHSSNKHSESVNKICRDVLKIIVSESLKQVGVKPNESDSVDSNGCVRHSKCENITNRNEEEILVNSYIKSLFSFNHPKRGCLLPNVPAENWQKFLSFINYIYSNTSSLGKLEDITSVPEQNSLDNSSNLSTPKSESSNQIKSSSDEKIEQNIKKQNITSCLEDSLEQNSIDSNSKLSISPSDTFATADKKSDQTIKKQNITSCLEDSLEQNSIDNNSKLSISPSDTFSTADKKSEQNIQEQSSAVCLEDSLGSINLKNKEDSFKKDSLLESAITSKLGIKLPIPKDQFNTCLDIALTCLTEGKTIEEMYSCHPLVCSGDNHFTSTSLENLFGLPIFKLIHKCHSHGNVSDKYMEVSDVNSEIKSGSSETVELLMRPSVIYSLEDEEILSETRNEKPVEIDLPFYDSEFLRAVPRAILHFIAGENYECGDNTVKAEDIVKYCYLIKNYKHFKQLNHDEEVYSFLEKMASSLKPQNVEILSEKSDSLLCTPPTGSSQLENSPLELDFEQFVTPSRIPDKLELFSKTITASIRVWLKSWENFKSGFFSDQSKYYVIEQPFNPECKDFPDSLVSKLLLSYGTKSLKIEPIKEELIQILTRDQSEQTMNKFIENLSSAANRSHLEETNEKILSHRMSDIFPYCPVTYKEEGRLFMASGNFTSTFKDELYNFATKDDQDKFLDSPDNYAVQPTSDYRVPPLRICILSNVYFDGERRLVRQLADHFNLQSISFCTEIKRLLLQNPSKHLGVISENMTNLESFDFGETMFDEDGSHLRKINYIRDYLSLRGTLLDSDMKILVNQLFNSETGIAVYGFPHMVEELSFIVQEKITPSVIVYIDIEEEKKTKIATFEKKIRDQQLLNYGSRLRKIMQLDHLKYILWNRARSKLFNIVLRQLLKERREKKFPSKRLKQLFPHSVVESATNGNLERSSQVLNNPEVEQNVEVIPKSDQNVSVNKQDSEVFNTKKVEARENIMNSPQITSKNKKEFKAYLAKKDKEHSGVVDIFNCESQTRDINPNKIDNIKKFPPIEIEQSDSSSIELRLSLSGNSQVEIDEKSLEDEEREEKLHSKQLAFMNLTHIPKEQDRFLPKFESDYLLPTGYDMKEEYYMERSCKGSSEWMGMEPTDSITSREVTSSVNLHPELQSNKKSRKIALQFGSQQISDEFLINAYDVFRNKYPPPKSFTKKLKPISFEETNESLNTYYLNEMKNINEVEDLCSKYNIPFIKHRSTRPLEKLIESIKSVTRWPNVFEKCRIITHDIAMDLLNNGHYFFSKFGRWCPVAIFEKRLPILQKYPEERMKRLVHPVIHKKYIYFIHTNTSLSKFMSSPLKYIEQEPYLSVFPVKIAVVGSPKSGKTKIIDYIKNMYGINVVRADSAVEYVCTKLHWTDLAQRIHLCLKQGNLLTSQLIVQAVEAYILSPKFINHGWILDGFPITKDDVLWMRKCDLIPQVTICIETNALWENIVSNKLHEDRIFLENLKDGFFSHGELKDDATVFWESQAKSDDLNDDEDESLFYHYILPTNFFKYRILKWRQNKSQNEDLIAAMHHSWGNVLEISWKKSNLKMVARILEFMKTCLMAFQTYAYNMQQSLPASMFCLNVSKEEFEMHMSEFKECCPCCWYYAKIYHRCPASNFRDITPGLFQYGNYIYWICTEHNDIFLSKPNTFLYHHVDIFRETYPERLSSIGEKAIREYYDLKFNGKCITCYLKGLPKIVLKQGLKAYALCIKKSIYLFCQESCLLSMLIKPQDYTSIKLPRSYKSRKNPPPARIPSRNSIVSDYFERSIYDVLCSALMRVAKIRPRIFEMNNETSSCIYLALIFKAHANKSRVAILNEIMASFEMYSRMIHIACSFIDKLACSLNIIDLFENEDSEVHTQYFFNRLLPLLASREEGQQKDNSKGPNQFESELNVKQ